MPQARKRQVSLDATPYYHLVSRCVRRAFLCGLDRFTGQCFDHRKQWLEDRFLELTSVFAVDLCAYAVLSNHYHIVVHVDRSRAESWSDKEVVARWHKLFTGTVISRRFLADGGLSKGEKQVLHRTIAEWRARLHDLGWFMRCINEPLARESNKEDDCTGRFWEGRYKSQALLDEKALLACMVYVDLNPIRGGISKTPETSNFTSVKKRIESLNKISSASIVESQPKELYPFVGSKQMSTSLGIKFCLMEYLKLVDCTARIASSDNVGRVAEVELSILERLGLSSDKWLKAALHFEEKPSALVGSKSAIKKHLVKFSRKRLYRISVFT